jgi:hypothetical protein
MSEIIQGETAAISIVITEDDGSAADLAANYTALQAAVYGANGQVYGIYTLVGETVTITDTSSMEFTIPATITKKMDIGKTVYAELKLTVTGGTIKKDTVELFTIAKTYAV